MAKKKSNPCKGRKATAKKRKKRRADARGAAGGHDVKSRRKFKQGGRVEAYTMGEAAGSKSWP